MLGLPRETEVGRMVAKKKFYDRADMTTALKDSFTNEVEKITWANKIAPTTLNVEAGSDIQEIEVFHIQLRQKKFNQKILETIDKAIPYTILYVLEYQGKQQLWLGYKEKSTVTGNTNIVKYFHNDWLGEQRVSLNGNKLSTIYENFLTELSADLTTTDETQSLEQRVAKTQEMDALSKQIEQLTAKMNATKQFNKKCELNREIKKLSNKLKELKK